VCKSGIVSTEIPDLKIRKNISETGPIPDCFKGSSVGGFWWGEGGEKFPPAFGTDSEDYFGYAWGTL